MVLKYALRAGFDVPGTQALKAAATSAQGLLSQAALTAPDAISSGNNSSSCIKRSYTGSAGNGGSGYNMGGGGESGNGSRRGRGSGRGDSTLAIAKELRNLCDASAKEALEQQAARMVMADPLAQLMASRGMPLGISIRHTASASNYPSSVAAAADVLTASHVHSFSQHSLEAIKQVYRKAWGGLGEVPPNTNSASSSSSASDACSEGPYSGAHPQQPQGASIAAGVTDVAVEVEVEQGAMQADSQLAAGGATQTASQQAAGVGQSKESGGYSGGGGVGGSGSGGEGEGGGDGDGKAAREWDVTTATTMASSAEIAQKIADSNAELARMVAEAEAAQAGSAQAQQAGAEEDDDLKLGPEDTKYKTLEQMSADIKGLDEVFELLASVPWLDEDDVKQKELKGMAMVSLLGTLEDVGFNIRPYVERIWAGESDDSMVQTCTEAKDQAAVLSILFHTRKIVEESGEPPRR